MKMTSKKECLLNQFRKTFEKKYENYCVTRIYNLVNNFDLQIITQQLFKRSNGKIALADIYFPQINMWIEIDEQYHNKQEQEDVKREEEIIIGNKIKKLEEVVLIKKLEKPYRIKVGNNHEIEDINKQIDEIVCEINNRINNLEHPLKWDCKDREPSEYTNKIICLSDNVKFRTIKKVTELFKNIKYRQQCAWFKIKENEYLWCPKLDLIENENKNCKWKNEISVDGNEICESLRKDKKYIENSINWDEKRITFAYYNDENNIRMYKFTGVFALDKEKTINCNFDHIVWKKYTDEVDLRKY